MNTNAKTDTPPCTSPETHQELFRLRSSSGVPAVRAGVRNFVNCSTEQAALSDFEMDMPFSTFVTDYSNAYASIRFIEQGSDRKSSSEVLLALRSVGIPSVIDYFCIKAISNGYGMDPEAVAVWDGMGEKLKESFRDMLRGWRFHLATEEQSAIISLVDRDAVLATAILRSLRIEEDGLVESMDSDAAIVGLSCIFRRTVTRLRSLGNPEELSRIIEASLR